MAVIWTRDGGAYIVPPTIVERDPAIDWTTTRVSRRGGVILGSQPADGNPDCESCARARQLAAELAAESEER